MAKKVDKYSCTIKELPKEKHLEAAYCAININPVNAPRSVKPEHIVFLTQKYWGDRAKDLTFGFMEPTSIEMRNKISLYANKWGEFSKVKIRWTQTDPMCRISFQPGGYWSYLGTDCLTVPKNQQTMNLERFTVRTADSEWERVVPHEMGHFLGCPHEQQRPEILALLDEQKTIRYFRQTQGWDEQEVRDQILNPLIEPLMGLSPPDQISIMMYSFPGSITKSGKPIPGGNTISAVDKEYFAKVYPKDDTPIVIPPVSGKKRLTIEFDGDYKIINLVSV